MLPRHAVVAPTFRDPNRSDDSFHHNERLPSPSRRRVALLNSAAGRKAQPRQGERASEKPFASCPDRRSSTHTTGSVPPTQARLSLRPSSVVVVVVAMSHATSPASSAVADAVEAQSPSLPPAAGARRPTRNRKAYSCTECRRRKKHCDRRVPGCNQCILRDTVHLCRWGDERDDDVVEQQQQQQPRPSSSMMQEGSTSTARGSEHRYHQRLPAHAQRSRSQSPPARTGWSRPQSHTPGTPHAWLTPEERCHVGRDSNPFGNANPLGETTSRSNEPASSPHETFSNSRRSTLSAHLSMRSPPSNSTDRARLEQEEQSILMSELSRAELDIGLDPSPVSQQDAFRTSMSSSRTTLPTHSTSKSDDHWRITPTDRSALTRSAQASDDAPIAGHPQLPQRRRSGKFSSASASTPQSNKGAVAPTRSGEKPLLTFAQATELFHLYKSLSNRLLMIETSEVKAALEEGMASLPPAGGGNIAEMRERVPDTYALLLVICASALSKMPSTYAITMGLVGRCESIPSLMQDLFRTAMQVIDSMPAPTFISIQARNLFQHNLTPALSAKSHLKILDRLIREARSLGLDRLGSPADDEALWRKRDEERDLQREHHEEVLHGQRTVNPGNEVLWAADTFRRRDRRARNLGRAHWMFLRAKDWVTSRIVGCYMVPDKSYTTSLPMPYTDRSEDLITEVRPMTLIDLLSPFMLADLRICIFLCRRTKKSSCYWRPASSLPDATAICALRRKVLAKRSIMTRSLSSTLISWKPFIHVRRTSVPKSEAAI